MHFKKAEKRMIAFLLAWLIFSLSIVQAETTTYNLTYDNIGNLQQSFGKYIEYNEFNQVIRVRENNAQGQILEEYTYDENGERIKKYESLVNQSTYYISDSFIKVVNATGTYRFTYYHQEGQLVARKDPDGKKFYYHPDHLGSTDLVTNQTGAVVEETTYEPYGEIVDGGESRFLFTSKELDTNTDMYYYGARYYDPFFSRFTQPDPFIQDIYNPQDLNRYSYVRNNPYKYVDPTGESPLLVTAGIGALVGAGLGATLSAISQYRATGSISASQTLKAAGVGAAAGGAAGLTFGVSSLALGGTATGVGLSTGAELSAGAVAGVAGGRTAQLTSNVVSGAPLAQGLFDPSSIAFEAATGGLTAGLARGIRSTQITGHVDPSSLGTAENSLSYHFNKHGDITSSKFSYVEQSRLFLNKYEAGKIPDATAKSTTTAVGQPATKITSNKQNRFGIYNSKNRKTVTYGAHRR